MGKYTKDMKEKSDSSRRPRFDEEAYQANKRGVAIVMNNFFIRYLNLLYNEFDGDLLLPIVLGEIAHHNISRFYSFEKNCIKLHTNKSFDDEDVTSLHACNAYSISEATGIPRETVRRKIDKLVKIGWLRRSDRSEVVISTNVGEHFMKSFNKQLLSELLDASDCLRALMKEK